MIAGDSIITAGLAQGECRLQYRKFGRTGWKVSALGFGMMRLPTLDGKVMSARIDREAATRMVRHAVDEGVNYIDTAYPYHHGRSEGLLGNILKDGYRDKVRIATKAPMWLIKKPADFDMFLDRQLRRLKVDSIDFYLFHGLNRKSWEKNVLKNKLLSRAEAAQKKGKIVDLGFSFHDGFSAFKQIVDGYDGWKFCQIQYNYMDTENQAGTKGLKYAASKGLGVIVMEPLLGGRLANPPKPITEVIKRSGMNTAPSELALRWIWDQPEVSVILSGMSTMGQVEGNLRAAEAASKGKLGKGGQDLIARIKRRYAELRPIPCTGCRYCMPCPNGVDIPRNFEEYVDGFIHHDPGTARRTYVRFFSKKERAGSCKGCGKCEEKCPQKIPISELMPKVHAVLGEGGPYGNLRR